MVDLMSILSANYKSVGLAIPSKTSYVAVDPKLYQGSWTGKYANNKTFKITVSNVSGFRAKVHYQSDTTSKYQDVLIKDQSFRVGDTKFVADESRKSADQECRHRSRDRIHLSRHGLRDAIQLMIRPSACKPCGRWRANASALLWPDRARENRRGGAAPPDRETGYNLARPVIDDLIDDRGGVAIEERLVRQ